MHEPIQFSIDATNGRELVSVRADEPHPPASLLKLATLYLAFEALTEGTLFESELLAISKRASGINGSCLGLKGTNKITAWEAIAGTAMVSGNDTAIVLAERLASSVENMISQIRQLGIRLGLSATAFHTVTGLHRTNQLSTARDMMTLARALIIDHPNHRHFLAMHGFVYRDKLHVPTSDLVKTYQGIDAFKTGTGNSGFHIAVSAKRQGYHVIAITLGCRDKSHRNKVIRDLLDRSFAILKNNRFISTANWTEQDVLRAKIGKWINPPPPNWQATGVSFGAAFSENQMVFVGEDFGFSPTSTQELIPKASAILCTDDKLIKTHLPVLHIKEPAQTLYAMAKYTRERFTGSVIGVTGSAGKTSTVAIIQSLLTDRGLVVHRNCGNTHLYTAQSIASTPPWADILLLELAFNLRKSTLLGQLHFAVVTTVSEAHLSEVSSFEALVAHKAAIFNGLIPGGLAVVNRDMPAFETIAAAGRQKGRLITYGLHEQSDVKLLNYNDDHSLVDALIHGQKIRYRLGMRGLHMAVNSLAALIVVSELGLDRDAILSSFPRLRPVSGRGAVLRLNLGDGPFTVLDESYNANPASMRASLALFASMRPTGEGRRIVLLGDMLEIGPNAIDLHRQLLPNLLSSKVDCVYLVGANMLYLWNDLPYKIKSHYSESIEGISSLLMKEIRPGDLLLTKGSHAIEIHRVVMELRRASKLQSFH